MFGKWQTEKNKKIKLMWFIFRFAKRETKYTTAKTRRRKPPAYFIILFSVDCASCKVVRSILKVSRSIIMVMYKVSNLLGPPFSITVINLSKCDYHFFFFFSFFLQI